MPQRANFVLALLIGALYLTNLTEMGMIGPDEPRYAAVGRAMAESGDWITPRLWGKPWFEKPALLYWMTAAATKLGLGPDLAPRLPVALLSTMFLAFFWWRLRKEWGPHAAFCSTAMLATSAGWLTYSHVAVTDLPLAVFFCAAVLLALPWVAGSGVAGPEESKLIPLAAACLGLAVLAKGLVPLVLFLPVVAMRWRRFGDWLRPAPLFAFAACALPWYALCTARNGTKFLQVFFVEHHFGRFRSNALQHVQPWWFYFPILMLLLFPWFPLLYRRIPWSDKRVVALGAVVGFGILFFSAAVNKLPGYLLPLLPPLCALIGTSLASVPGRGWLAVAPVTLLGVLPLASWFAPLAVDKGLRLARMTEGLLAPYDPWSAAIEGLVVALGVSIFLALRLCEKALPVSFALAAGAFLWFEAKTFPAFDEVSARETWILTRPNCASIPSRGFLFSLYYYAERELPNCDVLDPTRLPVVR